MATIGAAFLVKDPPLDRLAMLVEFLSPVVDEYVFAVDNRTDPGVVEKMSRWPDTKLVPIEWANDFSAARNAGLEAVESDWTLVLDPDEMPSFGMTQFLHWVSSDYFDEDYFAPGDIKTDPRQAKGWVFWTVNYWDGVLGPEYDYHWHVRLFKTGSGRFFRPVHELVRLDGIEEGALRYGPMLPYAPKWAHLIHSKAGRDIEQADSLYEKLGEVSR